MISPPVAIFVGSATKFASFQPVYNIGAGYIGYRGIGCENQKTSNVLRRKEAFLRGVDEDATGRLPSFHVVYHMLPRLVIDVCVVVPKSFGWVCCFAFISCVVSPSPSFYVYLLSPDHDGVWIASPLFLAFLVALG
jgi:hypothetical protein